MSKKPAPNSKAGRMAAAARRKSLASVVTAEDSAIMSPAKMSSRKGCLDTAMAAVTGDRALNYGSAEDNFGRIAHLMNAYLEIRKEGPEASANPANRGSVSRSNAREPITQHDVAIMSIMIKIARLANTPDHADSWADIAGYAACGAEINKAKY